jgi:hypothetical protein
VERAYAGLKGEQTALNRIADRERQQQAEELRAETEKKERIYQEELAKFMSDAMGNAEERISKMSEAEKEAIIQAEADSKLAAEKRAIISGLEDKVATLHALMPDLPADEAVEQALKPSNNTEALEDMDATIAELEEIVDDLEKGPSE